MEGTDGCGFWTGPTPERRGTYETVLRATQHNASLREHPPPFGSRWRHPGQCGCVGLVKWQFLGKTCRMDRWGRDIPCSRCGLCRYSALGKGTKRAVSGQREDSVETNGREKP